LGLLDLGECSADDSRRLSGSSLIPAFCNANAKVEGASKDPANMPSSVAGGASTSSAYSSSSSSSSSSSAESLRRPDAILAALRMAASMQSWTM
jgi:hypothetical protein